MIKFYENAPYVPMQTGYDVENILYKGKSRFQDIMVVENSDFGKMLLLDNVVQLTEADEFFYHEMLAHVVLHAQPNPKKVVVIGGGDGGVVREALKHKSIEKVWFIEIDEEVIKVSEKFFPQVASGNKDPRVEIKCMDGAEFVKMLPAKDIDAIIVDSTDIIGFARTLYTKEFFAAVRHCLKDTGMFVTHSESIIFHRDTVVKVQNILSKAFPVTDLYTAAIATYPGYWWSFSVGSVSLDPREVRQPFSIETKLYDDEMHKNAFLPRKFYKKLLEGKLGWGIRGIFE